MKCISTDQSFWSFFQTNRYQPECHVISAQTRPTIHRADFCSLDKADSDAAAR
jgi:hypothetical protein